ncbi:MAG TPA: hypothetical protein VFL07_02465 [Rudaea sp.]|nr:hypothetical protein [Rudaea sp.]
MTDEGGNAASPWSALTRRKLVQWALAYAAGAWVLLQVLSLLAGVYAWPPFVLRIGTGAMFVGLPVVVVLAWFHGERGEQKISGTELLIVTLLLALGGGALWRIERNEASAPPAAEKPEVTTSATAVAPANAKSIAVLPFENLSKNADNAYFVSGMQDLILTNLAKISDLKVISRTSTEKYASHPDNLKTVGVELGVATLLEGSVQRIGDQVLINLQLIEAKSDTHLWAESYNRKLEDIFSVEQEVARTVAAALQARLSPSETASIAKKPTENPAAYELFLRAEFLRRQGYQNDDHGSLQQATELYQQAIAADPQFALAQARLSMALSNLYWLGGQHGELQTGERANAAAQAAARLQPDLPETFVAIGEARYRVDLDLAAALAAFDAALAARPGYHEAIYGRALILRRQGRFADSLVAMEAAAALDPRDSNLAADVADTYWMQRRGAEAEAAMRRALAIDPANVFATSRLAILRLYRAGDGAGALAVLRGEGAEIRVARLEILRFERRYDEALGLLGPMADSVFADANVPGKAYWSGRLLFAAGQKSVALLLLRRAATELGAQVRALPAGYMRSENIWAAWAECEALLGNEAQALKIAAESLARVPIERDAVDGADRLATAAGIYGLLGRLDLLLPALKRLRELPGADKLISASTLRLDPVWDKVRSDPGFQAEIERFAEFDLR